MTKSESESESESDPGDKSPEELVSMIESKIDCVQAYVRDGGSIVVVAKSGEAIGGGIQNRMIHNGYRIHRSEVVGDYIKTAKLDDTWVTRIRVTYVEDARLDGCEPTVVDSDDA